MVDLDSLLRGDCMGKDSMCHKQLGMVTIVVTSSKYGYAYIPHTL